MPGPIVSASYRTDIPAFYAEWFRVRLAAGACRVRNPWTGAVAEVSLAAGAVDGFVFWTRNLRPFAPLMPVIRGRAPFVVQMTVTGYPRPLERSVIGAADGVAQLRALAQAWGGRAAVWRYDPVVISDLTPAAWHRANFARLADQLAGWVDEVVLSFLHPYRKSRRNLDRAAAAHGFGWSDPPAEAKRALLAELARLAAERGLRTSLCAQPELLIEGVEPARCIDAERLSALAGRPISARERGNRPGCACAQARDIGAYDTCPHGCVYCYAVQSRSLARRAHAAHDPAQPELGRQPDRDGA